MNESAAKTLRHLFIAPFPLGDPRNKGSYRAFKADYNGVPRPERAQYLRGLTVLKNSMDAANAQIATEAVA